MSASVSRSSRRCHRVLLCPQVLLQSQLPLSPSLSRSPSAQQCWVHQVCGLLFPRLHSAEGSGGLNRCFQRSPIRPLTRRQWHLPAPSAVCFPQWENWGKKNGKRPLSAPEAGFVLGHFPPFFPPSSEMMIETKIYTFN